LDASPAEVWEAVVDGSWLADEVVLDLRPGGDASFRAAGWSRSGWIEEVVAPEGSRGGAARLAFWWAEDGEPATRVELTIAAGEGATRLRVVETRPLDLLDLIGTPLPGIGGPSYGPALVAVGR
jgi:hypothetical protein